MQPHLDPDRPRPRRRRPVRPRHLLAAVLAAATGACAGSSPSVTSTPAASPTGAASASSTPAPSPSVPPASTGSPGPTEEPAAGAPSPAVTPTGTTVPLRVESRVDDQPTAAFASRVESILTDPRGWQRAGFTFAFDDADAPYRLVLAEGGEVDALCRPYDTAGRYSCQNGPVVALNADRWRTATPSWPGSLAAYRTMLVNHEVGHLLHLHHPRPQCPGEGLPAPVMAQQSTELGDCTANPWPLRWEVDLAAERAEPLAPPADHDVSDHRPSPPPATS